MKCQNCGAELKPGVSFCRECGAKVMPPKMFCRECGAKLPDGAKFCSNCGAKTDANLEQKASSTPTPNIHKSNIDSKSESENNTIEESISNISESASELAKKVADRASSFSDTVSEKAASFSKKVTETASSPKTQNSQTVLLRPLVIIALIVLIAIVMLFSLGKILSSGSKGVKSPGTAQSSGNTIQVVNVVDMSYPDAVNTLENSGFTNIVSNVDANSDPSLWVVTAQSVNAGKELHAGDKIELTCAMKCNLYLDISSDGNLLFSTYDISISLDGAEIGSVANGDEFTYLANVLSGNHEIVFCKSGNTSPKATKTVDISGDMTFSCDLSHDGSSISIKNENTENNINGAALEVLDVKGMILTEAMEKLSNAGFSNIREEPYSSIWNRDNWIVTNQSIEPGTLTDKNNHMQLDCISLNDYFNSTYTGKNVSEIQTLASSSGFLLIFEDTDRKDLDELVSTMNDATKKNWIATGACQYIGAQKTALVTIKNTAEVPETTQAQTAPQQTIEQKPLETKSTTQSTEASNSVSYSTNSKDTVKDGNAGVYSYKRRAGTYDIYYIIDFDEGYVYFFCDGNGDTSCDRIKIDSGTLNDVVKITYHDGNYTWQEGFHFKWAGQPDHLVMEDSNHFDYDFYTTDLDKALKIRDSHSITDY